MLNKYICILFLLSQSCGIGYLFQSTPEPIIEGLRETYKVSTIAEKNARLIAESQATQLKTTSTYYLTRIYEVKLDGETDEQKRANLIQERDGLITKFIEVVDRTHEVNMGILTNNFKFLNQLLEAIYNYHAIEPLSIEKIKFMVEEGKKLLKRIE